MDFRLSLIAAVTACAPLTAETPSAPAHMPIGAVAQSTVQAPAPAAPAPSPADAGADSFAASFDAWKQGFLDRKAGENRAAWARELEGLSPDETVVRRDRNQPEFSRSVGDYVNGAVTADRIAQARQAISANAWLSQIEARYGVPAEILVSIWANESAFGRIQGDFDVVRSLATLAWEGRRRDWAEGQLADALTIITSGKAPRSRLKGSWAGAMGQTQFMPDNYLRLGEDGDGDGVVDIWGSDRDSLASAANLLARAGWKRGQRWALEVELPTGFDYGLAEAERQPWSFWRERGVRLLNGAALTDAEAAEQMTVILPQGADGPAILTLPNHYIIRRYNNSTAYALAVGLLADRAMDRPGISRAWPVETPLSRDQRMSAQRYLQVLGFDPGGVDGIIGTGTRTALRRWQQARGLRADGYLTTAVLEQLQRDAASRL
ncbi:lytic murein transglycosylase [Brevundimonas sp. 2R-24]|uniref:Lytic murein transglycosylase n=1 Tax=Peiella sedimenti TaxID=3061083 RepID=A0ABT8SHV4_9CAUL|nr:lytic murein transglycosylase [Caulobacteraceae bacterium XZ-24]